MTMSTSDKLELHFLEKTEVKLRYNSNGFLMLTLNGDEKGRVNLKRCYPFRLPSEYICVIDFEDNEIGIIRDINLLDEESAKCAEKELERRYYCPKVDEIKSIKEKMGHFYFDIVIGGKKKTFTVRDISKNMRFSTEDTLLIFDMDGNRYCIENFSKTDPKSRRLLEPYLY